MNRCKGSQGWTPACCGMPERDGKNQEEDSPKQAGSCWFARPCWLATSGMNLSLSGVMFVSFCFVFACMLLLKPRSFDMQAPR